MSSSLLPNLFILKVTRQLFENSSNLAFVGISSSEDVEILPIKIKNKKLLQTVIFKTPSVGPLTINSVYSLENNQIVLTQSIDEVVGKRFFELYSS